MPRNRVVIEARSVDSDEDARLIEFERLNGKRAIVLSNRKIDGVDFAVDTNLHSRRQGYRYTPRNNPAGG